jgi:membrane dipeptidase
LFAAAFLVPLPTVGADLAKRPVAVVDLHVDLSYQHNYKQRAFDTGTGQYRASELRRAGVVGVVLPLYVPKGVSKKGPRLDDLEFSYARVFDALATSSHYALPGCTPSAGRVKSWLAFEGAAPLAGQPDRTVLWWIVRGARLFGLVHSYDNALASSATGSPAAAFGLTAAGRDLSRRIMAAGGMIDVSHASDRATREIVELAKKARVPVVATHSNARALANHPRNMSDELVRAIATTGGVIGVNFHGPFLARNRPASLDDVVRHIQHLVGVAGVDHVAIGSDFEGDIRPPPELASVAGFQRLAQALAQAGMPQKDVEKVFATNALRLLCRKH